MLFDKDFLIDRLSIVNEKSEVKRKTGMGRVPFFMLFLDI
jgi:hypothetical protein